ncbi:MAG: tail fiber domain-containing protein [Porticoccaceae bacterium]
MTTKSIYQLNPVSFDYKDLFNHYKTPNAANKEIGLIAEQVMPLIPEITLVEDNKVFGIDYPKLSILLLKAVQELRAEVTGLQQSNLQLQQQINNLTTSSPLHKSNEINEREEMQ